MGGDAFTVMEIRGNHQHIIFEQFTFCIFFGRCFGDNNHENKKRRELLENEENSFDMFFVACTGSQQFWHADGQAQNQAYTHVLINIACHTKPKQKCLKKTPTCTRDAYAPTMRHRQTQLDILSR